MVPRPIGLGAPQCARCGKAVYMAEQVIGPYSKPYHKPCLTCVVCNKRLDSTLLVEHEGDPYCKNCHKAHLGQGKGGFGLSVPIRPDKPAALQSKPASNTRAWDEHTLGASHLKNNDVDDRLNEELSGIGISARRDNPAPIQREPGSPTSRTRYLNTSRPTTVAQSIDDLIASGVEVPIPYSRNGGGAFAATKINDAIYGTQEETDGVLSSTAAQRSYALPELDDSTKQTDIHATVYDEKAADEPVDEQYAARPITPPSMRSPKKATAPAFDEEPTTPIHTRETIGSIRGVPTTDGLPAPQRKDPIALARERERGINYDGEGRVKTYSPRTMPVSPLHGGKSTASAARGLGDSNDYSYSPNSALSKMGLGSTVNAAAVGTPLCARCERPVYFAEQKQAAGRKWHRACLRCDGCSTTLESGKLEEGPLSAAYEFSANIWCRTCYAKRFGPKGIGVAGMSLPEMTRH